MFMKVEKLFYKITEKGHVFVEWFLGDCGSFFWICAIFGTIFFLLKVLTMVFVGFSGHHGDYVDDFSDSSVDGGFDHEENHHDGTPFKIITLHTITGFFMMFGWVGLACLKQYKLGGGQSILVATLSGFILMVVTALLFRGAIALTSDGDRFDVKKCVGFCGIVSQQIPSRGKGKVSIVANGTTREILAQEYSGKKIDSFVSIRVVGVFDSKTVVVSQIVKS
jgi:hypothetical protein